MECCEFPEKLLISVLPPLLLVEFVLGFLGNGLALWIFWFHLKPWKSSTVFLFNLALADFLLSTALPFRASYYHSEMAWKFGDTFCHISLFMLALNRGGSILFLMVVAVDRYLRVVHPHHAINSMTVSKAVGGAVGLWVVPISLNAHILTTPITNTTRCDIFVFCHQSSSELIWHKFKFLFNVYLTLAIIIFCMIRIISILRRRQLAQHAKMRKALRIVIAVVVLYIICFLPSCFALLLILFKTMSLETTGACAELEGLSTAFFITISLTYLNSMLDPMIYYFSTPSFKMVYRRALRLCMQRPVEEIGMSPSTPMTARK